MNRPVHFEILADEPKKIGEFYKKVFDWKINSWGDDASYLLVTTGPKEEEGIDGGIMGREFKQAVINTVYVSDLEASIKKVEDAGGKLVHGPNQVPEVGMHAYCEDPEGNMFGMIQADPQE